MCADGASPEQQLSAVMALEEAAEDKQTLQVRGEGDAAVLHGIADASVRFLLRGVPMTIGSPSPSYCLHAALEAKH